MGITQHTSGVDNVKSLANLAMMKGNLGKPGGGNEIIGRDPRQLFHVSGGVFFHGFRHGLKFLGARIEEFLVVQAFLEDHVHQAVDPGHIIARLLA